MPAGKDSLTTITLARPCSAVDRRILGGWPGGNDGGDLAAPIRPPHEHLRAELCCLDHPALFQGRAGPLGGRLIAPGLATANESSCANWWCLAAARSDPRARRMRCRYPQPNPRTQPALSRHRCRARSGCGASPTLPTNRSTGTRGGADHGPHERPDPRRCRCRWRARPST